MSPEFLDTRLVKPPRGWGGSPQILGRKIHFLKFLGRKYQPGDRTQNPLFCWGALFLDAGNRRKTHIFLGACGGLQTTFSFWEVRNVDQIWGSGPEHQLVTHARHFVFAPFQHGGSDFGSLNPQPQVSQHTLPHKVPGFREIERGPYRFDYRTPRHGGSRSFC